ncbi:MAG: sulfatase, partial [Anaerohalosphaeraceae bacterium]
MKNLMMLVLITALFLAGCGTVQAKEIIHDAEHYILEAQHGEKWSAEDKAIDKKLAELKEKHG